MIIKDWTRNNKVEHFNNQLIMNLHSLFVTKLLFLLVKLAFIYL